MTRIQDVLNNYLLLVGCVAATFALIAVCSGLVLVTRGIWWKSAELASLHRLDQKMVEQQLAIRQAAIDWDKKEAAHEPRDNPR